MTSENARAHTAEHSRRLVLGLVAIGLLAFGLRLGVILSRPDCAVGGREVNCFSGKNDALDYHSQGRLIAEGRWFERQNPLADRDEYGQTSPTATHPPAYPVFLGGVTWLGGESNDAHRVATAALGAVGVVLIAFAARKLAGDRAGLIAGAVAAFYPLFWVNDTLLLSEGLYTPLIALTILAAYRLWEIPGPARAAVLGGVIGMAALTRPEAILLVAFTVLPIALGARQIPWPKRVATLAVGGLVAMALVAPWLAFNVTRFDGPLVSSPGRSLRLGQCDDTYYGPLTGYWTTCTNLSFPTEYNEAQVDQILAAPAHRYLRDHTGRVPVVLGARVARLFHLYAPAQQIELDRGVENRGSFASIAEVFAFYAVLPFAIAGVVLLWRRRVAISPLMGPLGLALFSGAALFGITRFRTAADVAFVVAAAVSVELLIRRIVPGDDRGLAFRLDVTGVASDTDPPQERAGPLSVS